MSEVIVIDTTRPEDKEFNDDLFGTLQIMECNNPAILPYNEVPARADDIANSPVVVSGVPLYNTRSAEDLTDYLTPITGSQSGSFWICVGMQALSLNLGASLKSDVEKEEGACAAVVAEDYQDDPIFKDIGTEFDVVNSHRMSVDSSGVDKIINLASTRPEPDVSLGCENAMIRIDSDSPIYATQFHPEKSPAGFLLLRNFLELATN